MSLACQCSQVQPSHSLLPVCACLPETRRPPATQNPNAVTPCANPAHYTHRALARWDLFHAFIAPRPPQAGGGTLPCRMRSWWARRQPSRLEPRLHIPRVSAQAPTPRRRLHRPLPLPLIQQHLTRRAPLPLHHLPLQLPCQAATSPTTSRQRFLPGFSAPAARCSAGPRASSSSPPSSSHALQTAQQHGLVLHCHLQGPVGTGAVTAAQPHTARTRSAGMSCLHLCTVPYTQLFCEDGCMKCGCCMDGWECEAHAGG